MGEGDPKHSRPDRPDHQGWPAGAGRPGVQNAMVGVVVLAVEVDFTVPKQAADDREGFFESAHTPVVGEPEGVVLPPVPPGTEGDDQTSL